MFHSQSSVSEFLRFKSHLELSPVESYQSFDFVNFMLDGRPCFLQTDIKTPLWAFCISPVSSSISGKCGPHICGAEENPKNENFQSSCQNTDGTRKGSSVSQQCHNRWQHLVNNLIIIQQVQDHMCLIRSLGALSLSKTKKNIVIFTNVWRCHTDSNFLDSMLCSNPLPSVSLTYHQSEDKASMPLIVLTSQLTSKAFYLLVSLTLNSYLGNCNLCLDQSSIYCKVLSMRPVAEQQHSHFSSTINQVLRTNCSHYLATFFKEQ